MIADLAVLNGTSYVYFVQYLRHVLKLLPFQGATAPTRDTQGAASLALGLVLLAFQAVPVQIRNLSSLIFNMRYVMAQESDEVAILWCIFVCEL